MQPIKHGLKENWRQFTLLVIINAFVGGMVGLERAILPQIAEAEFHVAAKTAIFSFIMVFGVVKALTNYFTGVLANRFGRKSLLTLRWLFGIPTPFILMYAPSWNWIVAANILLGINQGLAWSSTVVMKIDLVGDNERGLAMGLNEFAGYLAVAVVAFLTGWIAANLGLRPYPFYQKLGLELAHLSASAAFAWIVPQQSWIGLWPAEIPQIKTTHIAFLIDYEDMKNAFAWLQQLGITPVRHKEFAPLEPVARPSQANCSVYFNDPDGNSLELICNLPDRPRDLPMMYLSEWEKNR